LAPIIRFDEARAWIFDKALPFWAEAGLDRHRGGAVEALDLSGRDAAAPFKRVRVQARQVYAFSHAHQLGWKGPALEAAEHCWRFLAAHARLEDGAWVRLLRRQGGVLDPTVTAYDMAFMLLALAWRRRTGETGALSEAHATLEALDRRLAVAPGLGWRTAEDDPTLWQNPHMHLLEAALELADAGKDERFADMARDVLTLFRDRLFDPGQGLLPEYFEPGWNPIHGARRLIEPGHLYEWVWLLYRAKALLGEDLTDEARALYAFAERHGPDPQTRLVDDRLTGDGLTRTRTSRMWTQTEALKAQLAMFEHQGIDTRARVAEILDQLLDRHLAVRPAGSWQDHIGIGFTPLATEAPASMLYHLLLAFAELLRLEPRLA
jgi:mannose/cellobiose epimerase-like protein (N-acyl-D-glucosamine 2-epimerase family)